MAITQGSIVQAKYFQTLGAQQVLNVQYYLVASKSAGFDNLEGFAQAAFQNWTASFAPLQSNQLTYDRCEMNEVNGVFFDIYVPAVPLAGGKTGEVVSTFESFSIRQVRSTKATRHGYKRFAGVVEGDVSNGLLTGPALSAWATAAEAKLHQPITLNSITFPSRSLLLQPIIWGGNDPAYPLGRYNIVNDVVVGIRTTTQNTRKVGRGA